MIYTRLLKQAKSATDNYEKLRKSHGVDPGQQLIETLTVMTSFFAYMAEVGFVVNLTDVVFLFI